MNINFFSTLIFVVFTITYSTSGASQSSGGIKQLKTEIAKQSLQSRVKTINKYLDLKVTEEKPKDVDGVIKLLLETNGASVLNGKRIVALIDKSKSPEFSEGALKASVQYCGGKNCRIFFGELFKIKSKKLKQFLAKTIATEFNFSLSFDWFLKDRKYFPLLGKFVAENAPSRVPAIFSESLWAGHYDYARTLLDSFGTKLKKNSRSRHGVCYYMMFNNEADGAISCLRKEKGDWSRISELYALHIKGHQKKTMDFFFGKYKPVKARVSGTPGLFAYAVLTEFLATRKLTKSDWAKLVSLKIHKKYLMGYAIIAIARKSQGIDKKQLKKMEALYKKKFGNSVLANILFKNSGQNLLIKYVRKPDYRVQVLN